MGFGGLNETIQTSVGQFLPPEPVSQGVLEVKESKKKGKTILKPIEAPPPITAQQETAPSILQDVRAADQYVTEQLVKDEPPSGVPLAESTVIEPQPTGLTPAQQVEQKWQELKDAKIITLSTTIIDGITGKRRRKKEGERLQDINEVSEYATWTPNQPTVKNKPGPKTKPVVAVATLITDE